MIVLRVENHAGEGAYTADGRGALYAHSITNCPVGERHPGPWNDAKLYPEFNKILYNSHPTLILRNTLFGFATVDQYFDWFYTHKLREMLTKIGMHISIYSVPDNHAVLGDAQCVFNRLRAVFVSKHECVCDRATLEQAVREAYVFELGEAD